jgi:hypothetical protein
LIERGWLGLAIAFTVFAMLLPVCIVKALDHARTAMPLRRDLEDGFVWVFEGRLAQARYEEEDPEVAQLLAAGLFVRGDVDQRLSVLPRSGRLLNVNGQNAPPDRRLHVATTAAWPTNLYRYSLPPEVKEVFGSSARELKRRRIAEPERAELKRHVTRLTAVPWVLIALTALMSALVDRARSNIGAGCVCGARAHRLALRSAPSLAWVHPRAQARSRPRRRLAPQLADVRAR